MKKVLATHQDHAIYLAYDYGGPIHKHDKMIFPPQDLVEWYF